MKTDSKITLFEGPFNVDSIFREKLYNLNEDSEEALFVCNLTDVAQKFTNWCTKLPRVKPFYAIKCNNDDNIIKLLERLGAGFDCASQAEIATAIQHGITPDRIIFANPVKPNSHIRYAAATNTSLMTFDSLVELERIHRIYPAAQLVLRFRCDAMKAMCTLGRKFGCDPKVVAPRLLAHAKKLGMSVVGICFHVGTGSKEHAVYGKAIALARELFDYGLTLGHRMSILDIGGGFPGDTRTDFAVYADAVNAALEEFFPEADFGDVRVIAEPGTYFVESACTVGVTVYSKNEIFDTNEKDVVHVNYFVNDGIHGCFNLVLFGYNSFIPRILARCAEDDEARKPVIECSIWGQSVNGVDRICDNVVLPKLDVGDVLIFPNVGNYSLVLATTFNGFPIARVLHCADRDTMKILGKIED